MTPARAANDAEQKSGHPLTLRPLAADDTFSPSTLGSLPMSGNTPDSSRSLFLHKEVPQGLDFGPWNRYLLRRFLVVKEEASFWEVFQYLK
ncbi:hypothetical protein TNCV_1967741 [Trichonephila clavipes]|nr:hypothetical protein TNCV_1967741 [Trichonephila clavipes]